MASHSAKDTQPLHELKHDAVPGYGRAFAIAFAAMTLYLAVILVTSPGRTKGHHKDHDGDSHDHGDKTEAHAPANADSDAQPASAKPDHDDSH